MLRTEPAIGEHCEIGWRLVREAWGFGYATEVASAALHDAFSRAQLTEILAYTSPDNLRSQAVMARLKLKREPSRDFVADFGSGDWYGLRVLRTPSNKYKFLFAVYAIVALLLPGDDVCAPASPLAAMVAP